jgi:TonB family protein
VGVNRTSTIELPRKPAGAFFRWETLGEPIAVHFQLNIVDLLERDLIQSEGIGLAGVLLGRIECGRKLTLIVEDYESASNLARLDTSDSELGDRHLLERIVDRWHSMPEKRISILGFYRSCPPGQISLNSDDLEISSSHLTEPERIFLLIEPQMAMASRATLYMVRDGAIAWQWHSVSFNRKELAEKGDAFQSSFSGLQGPSPQLQKVIVPEKQDSGQRHEKYLKASYKLGLALGIVAILITVAAGILPLRRMQVFHVLSGTFKVSDEPVALGLKLQHIGNDWQLSWDRSAPFLLNAAVGHLSITDGFIHKSVDLDTSELRNGSVMYTPISDDVTLRLEVVNAESVTLANETARMVAGRPPLPPDHLVQTIGGSPNTRIHPEKVISLASAPTPGIRDSPREGTSVESSIIAGSLPAKATIPLTMNPPAAAIGHESVNLNALETPPNVEVPLQGAEIFIPPLSPPAPAELDLNPTRSNLNSPSSIPTPDVGRADIVIPAELISGREPVYPDTAKRSHTTGTVELQFRVNPNGKIEDVKVMKGRPVLASAAVEAVQSWRYKPALVKGIPVDSSVSTTIVFKLN